MEDGAGGKSYGGRYAGGDFDLFEFLRRPQTIVRLICLIFAIIVFGCISDGCRGPFHGQCIFNKDKNACNYGIGIGVIAFLACIIFLALDTQFDSFSNAETRRKLVIADLSFSGIWCFLWFVGFCYLADTWRRAPTTFYGQFQINHARASIAFSFFSIITWAGLASMAFRQYKRGTEFENYHGESGYREAQSPYASFPEPGNDQGFQSQPFGAKQQQPVSTEYNVPSY